MKRLFLTTCLIMATSLFVMAQNVVKLPEPDKNVSMTLYQALQQRKSVREYSTKDIDDMKLSHVGAR